MIDLDIPTVKIYASTTSTKDGCLDQWKNETKVAITTTILGAGVSIEKSEWFDAAYLYIEIGSKLSPLADMIQLSARARSIKSKSLHYSSRSVSFAASTDICKDQMTKKSEIATMLGKGTTGVNQFHACQVQTNKIMSTDLAYNICTTREHLLAAHSWYNEYTDDYVPPKYEKVHERESLHSKRGWKASARRNRRMLNQVSEMESGTRLVCGNPNNLSNSFHIEEKDITDGLKTEVKVRKTEGRTIIYNLVVPMRNSAMIPLGMDSLSAPPPTKKRRISNTEEDTDNNEFEVDKTHLNECEIPGEELIEWNDEIAESELVIDVEHEEDIESEYEEQVEVERC